MTKTTSQPCFVWLGAGEALDSKILDGFTNLRPECQIVMAEAREIAASKLQACYTTDKYTVDCVCIDQEAKAKVFYTLNLKEYSGLQQPKGLSKIYPSLAVINQETVNTVDIVSYISSLNLNPDQPNHIHIDIIAQVGSLLRALIKSGQILLFSDLHFVTSDLAITEETGCKKEIDEILVRNGYEVIDADEDDPDLVVMSYKLNPLWKTLVATKSQLAKVVEERKQFEELVIELQKRIADVEKEKVIQINNLQLELEKTDLKVANLAQELVVSKDLIGDLNDQTKRNEECKSLLSKFELKVDKLFSEQNSGISNLVNKLNININSGLANTAKQLESFYGIQNYLKDGVLPLNFHGWPISPDLGLYLTGLIQNNDYDVIIEFGSGTSTVLMAKSLQVKSRNNHLKSKSKKRKKKDVLLCKEKTTKIVTFEHNSDYYTSTSTALKNNGVDELVDLELAPLTDYEGIDGERYLYYSCYDKLQELSSSLNGKKANILVLVDGPPGSTNKNARFPALPHLLSALPDQKFTFIMDDYNRSEEKEIVGLWLAMAKEKFLDINIDEVPSEKGLAIVKVK